MLVQRLSQLIAAPPEGQLRAQRKVHPVFRYAEETGLTTLHEYACDETVAGFWGQANVTFDSDASLPDPALYVAVKKENSATPACGIVHVDVF